MARGQEGDGWKVDPELGSGMAAAGFKDMLDSFSSDAGAHEAPGGLGQDHPGVRFRVVAVGVGYEYRFPRADGIVGIEP
jgi:hypothetical protein